MTESCDEHVILSLKSLDDLLTATPAHIYYQAIGLLILLARLTA